ncbi:hemolysin III family protein [Candidatus Saccharibacteria bacterium]|nr:hemolysin III family protein [Candidatus Saccharibacteria bacterium]
MERLSRDGSTHVTNEIINTSSHLAAGCLALLGSVLLIAQAVVTRDWWAVIGFVFYSLSLLSLFTFSTLHHGLNLSAKTNQVLRTFDYVSIFALIAGTVTPIVLIQYRSVVGWSVLMVVWALAALGISLRASLPNLPKYITNTMFIVMGWLPAVLVLIGGITMPSGALLLLAAGGLLYSGGFVLYIIEKPNPMPGWFGFHEIWHIMVAVAALCHYLFMYIYLL